MWAIDPRILTESGRNTPGFRRKGPSTLALLQCRDGGRQIFTDQAKHCVEGRVMTSASRSVVGG